MKEAPGSSETSVLTRATWHNNPEDTILVKLTTQIENLFLEKIPDHIHSSTLILISASIVPSFAVL
jgi:hypothetical protein